ncbi:hypothetical protein LCGC14_1715760 [marine sediment metagenome]|uniref:Uncharacterized protein n=1 Tax=marine sediment metagenome TaxID=412755 RepID=A0A0F9JUC7_9ZZZZ
MFHVHKWTTYNSQTGTQDGGRLQVTLFSQKCRCGDWRITQEAGAWTLQDGFPVAHPPAIHE